MNKKESWKNMWIEKIKEAVHSDQLLGEIVDKIYEDGWADCEMDNEKKELEQTDIFDYMDVE